MERHFFPREVLLAWGAKHLVDIQYSTLISAYFSLLKSSWVEKALVRTFLDLSIISQFEDRSFLGFIKCFKGSASQHLGCYTGCRVLQLRR